jgi:hypothetical protein
MPKPPHLNPLSRFLPIDGDSYGIFDHKGERKLRRGNSLPKKVSTREEVGSLSLNSLPSIILQLKENRRERNREMVTL